MGLKPGAVYTAEEMNDHSKLLMDTGLFDNLTYKFDGVDLIFNLIPTTELYPIRVENLPLNTEPELDAKLHDRFPLYHGKVPAEGTELENVRCAFEELLATQGIKATVTAIPFGLAGTRKISAMNFSVAAPPVRVGSIQLQGDFPAMADRVKAIAD
jgi:hypothetical protein